MNLKEKKVPEVSDKFQGLLRINGDTVGWIKIEDTQINYPVVKSNDNDYYLHHNFEKETNPTGCIFMDCRNNSLPLDTNTILYGHNMKDASMFHDIIKYKEEAFFNNNDKIIFNTLYQENEWQVFSVYVTDVSFNYLITNFANMQGLVASIQLKTNPCSGGIYRLVPMIIYSPFLPAAMNFQMQERLCMQN